MADENDNSLYMAGGAKVFNERQRLTAKQEKVAGQQQQIIDENKRDKAKSVSNIKRISENQGGKPLTSENVLKLMNTLTETIVGRVGQLTQAAEKQIGPIDEKLKKINDLLSSNREDDMDKGFELIDKLEKVGIDFNKFSEKTAKEMQKLFTLNANRKMNNEEEERIRIKKTEELTKERDILRERGINTVLNEKGTKLLLLTKQQEREELKKIRIEEKAIEKAKEKARDDAKKLQNEDKIIAKDRNKILKDNEKITKREEDLQKAKERMGLKPKERVSGLLDQSVGEAFRQIKGFGKEIVQLGGDLFKGFGKLAGAVGRVAMGFLALLKPLIPFILIAVMIGVVIYALYKVIKGVIDFFANIFDEISKIWPFSLLKDDDNKNEEIGDPNKTAVPGQEDKESPEYQTDIQKRTGQDQMVNRNEIDGETISDRKAFDTGRDSDAMKILPINAEDGEDRRSINQMTRNVRSQNLNQMSVENQASNESKPTNNTVVAPNISNSSVNASNTQAMSMEPTNFDRSFINLNSVPV